MNGAFYIGATGLDAQQRALEVIANNVANINTPAFKRSAVRFSEMVATTREDVDLPFLRPDRTELLAGVGADVSQRVWAQGDLKQTGGQFDLAIDGDGFIEVMGADGAIKYWRGGTLKVNEEGFLATADGFALHGMITIPADTTALTIGRDGVVTALTGTGASPEKVGQIDIALLNDPANLRAAGNGYFESRDGRPATMVTAGDEGSGALMQGSIETSNVDLSDQMVMLLLLQRAYGANAQVVQAGDQLMSIVNTLRR